MPCYDPMALSEDRRAVIGALNRATRAACDMRTIIKRMGLLNDLTDETRQWIADHDKADAERIAREETDNTRQTTRERGLAKLTLEERRALGL